jgi:hypothetical protein
MRKSSDASVCFIPQAEGHRLGGSRNDSAVNYGLRNSPHQGRRSHRWERNELGEDWPYAGRR